MTRCKCRLRSIVAGFDTTSASAIDASACHQRTDEEGPQIAGT